MLARFLADLAESVRDHRPHGPLTGNTTEPAWNGYRLTEDARSDPSSSSNPIAVQ